MKLNLEVYNQTKIHFPAKIFFILTKKTLQKKLPQMIKKHIFLSVFLVSPLKIKILNKKYLKRDKPTTVLSFPQDEPLKNPQINDKIILGDIFLCPAEIKKTKLDLNYFFLHGLYHLLGLNHQEMTKQ